MRNHGSFQSVSVFDVGYHSVEHVGRQHRPVWGIIFHTGYSSRSFLSQSTIGADRFPQKGPDFPPPSPGFLLVDRRPSEIPVAIRRGAVNCSVASRIRRVFDGQKAFERSRGRGNRA
jgi:hypothetical protein